MSTTVKSNVHVPVVFIIGYDPGLGGGGGNLYDDLDGEALSLREDWLTVLYEPVWIFTNFQAGFQTKKWVAKLCYRPALMNNLHVKDNNFLNRWPTTEWLDAHLAKSLFSGDGQGTPGIV